MSEFKILLQEYWKIVAMLGLTLSVFGYLTYSFVSPNGRFSSVDNDLKAIEPEPEAAYTDLSGNLVQIRDYRGKPLIVNSWASWMPFSQAELTLLGRILKEYEDKVSVLAINRMESKGVIQGYLSAYSFVPEVRILIDPTDHFYKAVGGYAMPETIFYSREGDIAYHMRGVLTEEVLRMHIESLITE